MKIKVKVKESATWGAGPRNGYTNTGLSIVGERMRQGLGRSNGRRVGAKRSSKRERITPLVLAYIEANPKVKRSAVADMFDTNPKMIHRILADAGAKTFHRKRPKQLELFAGR